VVSADGADFLVGQLPDARCLIVPNLHEVVPIQAPFDRRCGVPFVGGEMDSPNIDAAHFVAALPDRLRMLS